MCAALFCACASGKKLRVEVINNSALDRTNELVEVPVNFYSQNNIVVLDKDKNQVPYQYSGTLIFPATVKANETSRYIIKRGVPEKLAAKLDKYDAPAAGGIAPYADGVLWTDANNFDDYKILEEGPLLVSVELAYNKTPYKDLKENIVVSKNLYSRLNKVAVFYGDAPAGMLVGSWIELHKNLGKIAKGKNYLAYAEDAVSGDGAPLGRVYGAVVVPGMTGIEENQTHIFALAPYKESFVYYFGQSSGLDFDTDDAWFKYVRDFAQKTETPLTVKIK